MQLLYIIRWCSYCTTTTTTTTATAPLLVSTNFYCTVTARKWKKTWGRAFNTVQAIHYYCHYQFLSLLNMWGNKSLNKPLVAVVIKYAKLFYQVTVNFTFRVLFSISASASLQISTHFWLMLNVWWPSQLNGLWTIHLHPQFHHKPVLHFPLLVLCMNTKWQMSTKTCIFHYCRSCQSQNC